VLSGLLLNAALHAVLRAKAIVGAHAGAAAPGRFLVALGLASLLVAAFALWRRRDARRFFAWSSIEHMGLAAIAFGLGGVTGNLAGLLHMLGHSLCKSAVFFGLGAAVRLRGSQKTAEIAGLCASHPALGWTLAIGVAAVAGLPPFALFASEFLLLAEIAGHYAWAILPVGLGLLTATAAKIHTMQALCLGEPVPDRVGAAAVDAFTLGPMWLHLVLAMLLGLALPGPLAAMLGVAAGIPG
jgi:hydrogenase-4 component F